MSIIALIPARGGSKGIPRKNIKLFCGKPLIYWSIKVALENKFILKNVMGGGFFDSKKLTNDYLNLLCKSIKKKGYVYHFRNVLSNFKKDKYEFRDFASVTKASFGNFLAAISIHSFV